MVSGLRAAFLVYLPAQSCSRNSNYRNIIPDFNEKFGVSLRIFHNKDGVHTVSTN